jgi:hypothetical protein
MRQHLVDGAEFTDLLALEGRKDIRCELLCVQGFQFGDRGLIDGCTPIRRTA